MYNTLMKHYEGGKSFFWVYLHRHVGIVYKGNWFEEHIRVLSQLNVMKTWLQTFYNQKTFFSKQYYFIDTIQNVLFQVREWNVDGVEVWWLLL